MHDLTNHGIVNLEVSMEGGILVAMRNEDQVQEFTTKFAKQAQAQGVKPQIADMHDRSLLIDFDGFFKTLVEMGEHPASEAIAALPLNDFQAARVQTYRQLFESAMWFPRSLADGGLRAASAVWGTLALKSAVIAATNEDIITDQWGAFYAHDLDHFMKAKHPELKGTLVKLTLARRLVARTHLESRTIYISALTRFYLMEINTALANYAESVVEHGEVLTKEDTFEFFEYTLEQFLPLHRPISPSRHKVIPWRASSSQFAQRITQIQMTFLAAHEYGHLVIGDDNNSSLETIEQLCDNFAFETLTELETPNWMQFLAVRWLFEVLAFDRILAECLAFDGTDWHHEIDWLQEEIRERRGFSRFLNDPESSVLSLYESVGSMFLLDLKGWLSNMGPETLDVKARIAKRQNPVKSGTEYSETIRSHFDGMPDDKYTSAKQIIEWMSASWNQSASDLK